MDLEKELQALAKEGCYPCFSLRGYRNGRQVWRAHVNGAGSYWSDGSTPSIALRKAIATWKRSGKTMDGYAVTSGGPYGNKN